MTTSINGTTGVTFPDGSNQLTGWVPGMRNRIINGAMMIDQRNAGASVTPTANGVSSLDRWSTVISQASKFSMQQNAGSVTPPAGFSNYLGITSLSAYTVGAGESFNVQQIIEGYNIADLGWGAAGASTVTLSFWIRSSLTGTFGGAIANYSVNRSYPFTFTINAANTWEQKTITVAGDTTGTWGTTNSGGLRVWFSLGCGSTMSGTAGSWTSADYRSATGATSVVGTNGATFYITGVQLEKGSTATSFDYRPYGTELALCQRYYYRVSASGTAFVNYGNGYAYNSTDMYFMIPFPVQMRVAPTGGEIAAAANYLVQTTSNSTPSSVVYQGASVISGKIKAVLGSVSGGFAGVLLDGGAGNTYIGFTGAEL